jgi:hypothetical protein
MNTMKYHSGYTPDDAARRPGIRFKAKGDEFKVVPLFTPDGSFAVFVWPRHWLGAGAKPQYATCGKLYGPDAPCPLCAKNMKQDWRASLTVWDVQVRERRYLDGINMAGFRRMEECAQSLRDEGQNPAGFIFKLKRVDTQAKGELSVTTVPAKPDDMAQAAAMVAYTPEEMVEESTPSAQAPASDAPPHGDDDMPF